MYPATVAGCSGALLQEVRVRIRQTNTAARIPLNVCKYVCFIVFVNFYVLVITIQRYTIFVKYEVLNNE